MLQNIIDAWATAARLEEPISSRQFLDLKGE